LVCELHSHRTLSTLNHWCRLITRRAWKEKPQQRVDMVGRVINLVIALARG
jgi:hypothetical protein